MCGGKKTTGLKNHYHPDEYKLLQQKEQDMKKKCGVNEVEDTNVETDPLIKTFCLLSEIVAEYQQQEEEETNTPEIVEIKEYFNLKKTI